MGDLIIDLPRVICTFLQIFISTALIKTLEIFLYFLGMSRCIGLVIVLRGRIMTFSFLLFNVEFMNFLSGKFFKIIVRISFNLNFLTCDNFQPVFIDHFCFYLHIGVIIWRFGDVMLTGVACWWVFYDKLVWVIILLLLFEFFVVKYFLGYGHFGDVRMLLRKRWVFWWWNLIFWDWSLLLN